MNYRNIVAALLLAGSGSVFTSCGTEAITDAADAITELTGTWATSCQAPSTGQTLYTKITQVFATTSQTATTTFHSDDACATDAVATTVTTYSWVGGSTLDGGGRQFNKTVSTVTYTLNSADQVTSSNSASFCGFTDWALNTAKDVAGNDCVGGSATAATTVQYDIYKVTDNSLVFGDSSTPVTTEASRPTTFSTLTYTKSTSISL